MVDIHQPEYWGYIQFSSGAPNTTAAVKDPSWTLRSVAMQIYYAQVRILRVAAIGQCNGSIEAATELTEAATELIQ